ncbi:MAG: adenylate kinase [Candidatus Micrarchaeota archaeon]|nr:adenylate kinase [Candidatus Micrarchaeota archaeon]
MIIVMGLPGAGKSTVLSAASSAKCKLVNYGDLMLEIASKKFGVKHRDELRKLDVAKQKQVQSAAANALAKMKGKVVLDTHCSISTPKGYLPGLPFSLLSKLKVDCLVLITAPIEEIVERRRQDKSRIRDEQSPESLSEHDFMNRAFLASYSAFCGAPAVVIVNRNGKLEEAQQKFLQLLQ